MPKKQAKPSPAEPTIDTASLVPGELVRLKGTHRRGRVRTWPTDAIEAMQLLRKSHVPVMPVKAHFSEEPELQYWPNDQIARNGQPDDPPPPSPRDW